MKEDVKTMVKRSYESEKYVGTNHKGRKVVEERHQEACVLELKTMWGESMH